MTYSLGTNNIAIKALEIQQAIIGNDSIQHLYSSGLKRGDHVWELGCGSGAVTLEIAKIITKTGYLTAVDMSNDQLDRVKVKAKKEAVNYIDYLCCDIESYNFSKQRAHFVCGRYILMHLQNPLGLLQKLANNLVVPGGTLCFQEGSWQDTQISGRYAKHFQEFVNAVIKLGKVLNVDYNLGRGLNEVMADANLNNIVCTRQTYVVPQQYISEWWQIRLFELGPKFIAYGIIDNNTLGSWQEMAQTIHDTKIEISMYYARGRS